MEYSLTEIYEKLLRRLGSKKVNGILINMTARKPLNYDGLVKAFKSYINKYNL